MPVTVCAASGQCVVGPRGPCVAKCQLLVPRKRRASGVPTSRAKSRGSVGDLVCEADRDCQRLLASESPALAPSYSGHHADPFSMSPTSPASPRLPFLGTRWMRCSSGKRTAMTVSRIEATKNRFSLAHCSTCKEPNPGEPGFGADEPSPGEVVAGMGQVTAHARLRAHARSTHLEQVCAAHVPVVAPEQPQHRRWRVRH